MTFDLERTALHARPFERVQVERTDNDWVFARVEDGHWRAACGPENLEEALSVFLDWANKAGP